MGFQAQASPVFEAEGVDGWLYVCQLGAMPRGACLLLPLLLLLLGLWGVVGVDRGGGAWRRLGWRSSGVVRAAVEGWGGHSLPLWCL